jgi:hypothetical protein
MPVIDEFHDIYLPITAQQRNLGLSAAAIWRR